jgi:hypothetical protein
MSKASASAGVDKEAEARRWVAAMTGRGSGKG